MDVKSLRLYAQRLRSMRRKLLPVGSPAGLEALAELDALARDFQEWADEIEVRPKANGEAQLLS